MKDIIEIILNPIRVRIIQEAAANQNITANELCDKIKDIPRTTLYRHINILLNSNILSIVSEKKVRGSLERTLCLNTEEMLKINSMELASQNALSFLMYKFANFQNYFNSENPDPAKDKIFLSNSILMLDDQEFEQFLSELWELIKKYNFDISERRKARDISIISSPNNKNEEENI